MWFFAFCSFSSGDFLERINHNIILIGLSAVEINQGNRVYIKKILKLIKNIKNLRINKEVESLSVKYMKNFNFPDKLVRDIFHIAISVYYEMDFLLTWNCSHIANAHFKLQLEQYNIELGYKTPILCTPEELVKFP